MTRKPICGECSTRYEGVNYSREGLELLRKQRAESLSKRGRFPVALVLSLLGAPIAGYLMFLAYLSSAEAIMALLH